MSQEKTIIIFHAFPTKHLTLQSFALKSEILMETTKKPKIVFINFHFNAKQDEVERVNIQFLERTKGLSCYRWKIHRNDTSKQYIGNIC